MQPRKVSGGENVLPNVEFSQCVSACVCMCFRVSICKHRYHYGRTGTVKAMSCSGLGGIFFESTLASEKTRIYI